MNAELKRKPSTEGLPFCRDLMLRKVLEVEIEMNKKAPSPLYTHAFPSMWRCSRQQKIKWTPLYTQHSHSCLQ